jgi:hypothetical protein
MFCFMLAYAIAYGRRKNTDLLARGLAATIALRSVNMLHGFVNLR